VYDKETVEEPTVKKGSERDDAALASSPEVPVTGAIASQLEGRKALELSS